MKLRPHLQSFLNIDIATALTHGPVQVILEILLHCGRILLQMRDDYKLIKLLNRTFQELKADPKNSSPTLLSFYELSANNVLNQERYKEAEYLN